MQVYSLLDSAAVRGFEQTVIDRQADTNETPANTCFPGFILSCLIFFKPDGNSVYQRLWLFDHGYVTGVLTNLKSSFFHPGILGVITLACAGIALIAIAATLLKRKSGKP